MTLNHSVGIWSYFLKLVKWILATENLSKLLLSYHLAYILVSKFSKYVWNILDYLNSSNHSTQKDNSSQVRFNNDDGFLPKLVRKANHHPSYKLTQTHEVHSNTSTNYFIMDISSKINYLPYMGTDCSVEGHWLFKK